MKRLRVCHTEVALTRMTSFFFFNDTATTEISTLSLHDALPIWPGADERAPRGEPRRSRHHRRQLSVGAAARHARADRDARALRGTPRRLARARSCDLWWLPHGDTSRTAPADATERTLKPSSILALRPPEIP